MTYDQHVTAPPLLVVAVPHVVHLACLPASNSSDLAGTPVAQTPSHPRDNLGFASCILLAVG